MAPHWVVFGFRRKCDVFVCRHIELFLDFDDKVTCLHAATLSSFWINIGGFLWGSTSGTAPLEFIRVPQAVPAKFLAPFLQTLVIKDAGRQFFSRG